MDINKFIKLRPYLYHLTDRRNLDTILAEKQLKSTKLLADIAQLANRKEFLTSKRKGHKEIKNDGKIYYIRDQNPIIEKVLKRSLDPDCTYEDFILLLNSRVFFWPTLRDLQKHFGTYADEKPIILRLDTQQVFRINNPTKFCKLNSGATRCVKHHNGNAAPRGFRTFLSVEECPYLPSQIREVTFENYCNLPEEVYISNYPDKFFKLASDFNL